ncbi:toxin-antitoxin system [Nocardiopsis sp. CNT-189]
MKRRLRIRAAQHGRSIEAEIRHILEEAVRETGESEGPFSTLLDRFGELGGVDIEPPQRSEPPRSPDFGS